MSRNESYEYMSQIVVSPIRSSGGGEWGTVISKKIEKWDIFNSRTGDQILLKFDI